MSDKNKDKSTGHVQEHPDDPVYVPDFSQIEKLVKKMSQEHRGSDQLDYKDVRETICGAIDDSQAVEQYDGTLGVTRAFVDTHQSAVGVLRWHTNLGSHYTNPGNVAGHRWCTGTLISDNLFLTAGHCFDQTGGGWNRPRVNGSSNIISPQEIATRMNVEFDFQLDASGTLKSPVSVAVEELIEYRLDGLDFAIVRLAGNPGQQFGTTELAEDDGSVGDMICIIGHPAGQPKRIEAGPITSFQDFRVRYNDIDTLGGNSGSGILRASDGAIVGIHTNGGCNAAMTGSNFGLRITRLRDASPTVQGLALRTSPIRDVLATTTVADRLTLAAPDRLRTRVIDDTIRTQPRVDQITTVINDRPTDPRLDRPTSPVLDRQTGVIQDIRTTPNRDITPTNVIRDQQPTNPIRDAGPTSILQDRGTSPLLDRGTSPFTDFQSNPGADPSGTGAVVDRPTNPIGDQGGKAPTLDQRTHPFMNRVITRGNLRREMGGQPFVMATPHHASGDMAGLAQTGGARSVQEELDEMLAYHDELSQTIQALTEELAEIEATLEYYDEYFAELDMYDEGYDYDE